MGERGLPYKSDEVLVVSLMVQTKPHIGFSERKANIFLPLNVLLMVLHKEISISNIKHLILCVGVCQIRPEPCPDKSPRGV